VFPDLSPPLFLGEAVSELSARVVRPEAAALRAPDDDEISDEDDPLKGPVTPIRRLC